MPFPWVAVLLLYLGTFAISQHLVGSASPTLSTALWTNSFAAVVGLQDNETLLEDVLEEAVRQEYTEAGYAISLVDVKGCNGTSTVSNADGYMPTTDMELLDTFSPAEAPVANILLSNQPPLLVRASCYKLSATLYFPPSSTMYLDAAAGTSNGIVNAISNNSFQGGVHVKLYLLNVTLAPAITNTLYTGDSLQHIKEIGYVSTIWVAGSNAVPVDVPQVLALHAAFSLLELPTTVGVVRNKIVSVVQNSTGANVSYLSIVRPTDSTQPFPETLGKLVTNGSYLAVVRAAGLDADSVTLWQVREDNSTTIGSQLSMLLAQSPVVSSIGITKNGPPSDRSGTRSSASSNLSTAAVAGITMGAVVGCMLISAAGLYMWRLNSSRKGAGLSIKDVKPTGLLSSSAGSPVGGSVGWTSLAGEGPQLADSEWSTGSWELLPGSIDICKHPDGSDFVLGNGTYGVVYKARLEGRQDVAVKMLNRVDEWQLQQFRHEADLLRKLPPNSNVVKFFGACFSGENPFLVLEYMDGGDLRDALSDPRVSPMLDWDKGGKLIALQVIQGLMFLHSNSIIHADLKSKNVLLSSDLRVAKIADVGLSRIMHGSHASSNSDCAGTFSYAAPEQILGYSLTPKAKFALAPEL